ncbi:MAG: CpaF family protein [Rhodospirillales bacterium]
MKSRAKRFGKRTPSPAVETEYISRDIGKAERRKRERRIINKPVSVERRRGNRREKKASKTRSAALGRPGPDRLIKDVPHYVCEKKYSPSPELRKIKERISKKVVDDIKIDRLSDLPKEAARDEITATVIAILHEENEPLSESEQAALIETIVDDMLGYGPLEPLLADASVTDVMVNGPDRVWVERAGKLELSDVTFDSRDQLMNVIDRIVTRVHRRVDHSSPMVDARLPDGSRVNVIIPPLSVHFPSMSIRKFADVSITLDDMVQSGGMSYDMAVLLQMIAKYRLNVLISGGTGAGKTTLLGAMSNHISATERIVTIEDTAELRLPQPNIVTLEKRPPNLEGTGAVEIGDLLVNALRMRPDRILVGEVRGAEAGDMLQAMNTGHDGSLGTIHANSPRDALVRFENMICMNPKYTPGKVTRQQIMSALDVVVQMSRLNDGVRRVTCITEIVGMEEDIILTQNLYEFKIVNETADGLVEGNFKAAEYPPHFSQKIKHYSLTDREKRLLYL